MVPNEEECVFVNHLEMYMGRKVCASLASVTLAQHRVLQGLPYF